MYKLIVKSKKGGGNINHSFEIERQIETVERLLQSIEELQEVEKAILKDLKEVSSNLNADDIQYPLANAFDYPQSL